MFCSKCGKEITSDNKYCPSCGNELNRDTSMQENYIDVPEIPKKKSMSKKKGCFGCLGLIVILFIISGMIASCDHKDSASSNKSTSSSSQQKAAPPFTATIDGIGTIKGGVSSNVGIAIADVQEVNVLGNQFSKTQAQGKFVVVKLAIVNNQKDAITVDANSFKLVDDKKREFSVSVEGQTAIQMANGNAKGFLTKINPGISMVVSFPYDVPNDVKGLILKAHGGFAGDEITLPLEVQKVQ